VIYRQGCPQGKFPGLLAWQAWVLILNLTEQEVADILGIHIATVRQVEARALSKLRKALRKRGVAFEDFAALFGTDQLDGVFKRN